MSIFEKLFKNHRKRERTQAQTDRPVVRQNQAVSVHVGENLAVLSDLFGGSEELKVMRFDNADRSFGLAYLESLTDRKVLQQYINLLYTTAGDPRSLDILGGETTQNIMETMDKLVLGYSVLFSEGSQTCLVFPVLPAIQRETKQPEYQRVYTGPKDGLVENVHTNLFLIRRRIKDRLLRVRKLTVGTRSQNTVHILYIEDLAPTEIVDSIVQRLEAVKADIILDSKDLYEYICDSWLSPFPQANFVERPDVVAAALCEGRVAVLHDTSPVVLLAPVTFFDQLDVPDDYYVSWSVSASIIRFIRMAAIFLAAFVPSLYIALTAYNPDFIPTSLAFIIAASREGVPFPVRWKHSGSQHR